MRLHAAYVPSPIQDVNLNVVSAEVDTVGSEVRASPLVPSVKIPPRLAPGAAAPGKQAASVAANACEHAARRSRTS